ncbi:hypothetical protein EDB83DRAFT_2332735 [Lactarius deliciosus]|nr:hypothetical protein EDB83DRAFT_2332735 [Lactarius deliciosus]
MDFISHYTVHLVLIYCVYASCTPTSASRWAALWKPFLQITEDEIDHVADAHIKSALASSHQAITAFQDRALDERDVMLARLQCPATMPNSAS